MLNNSTANKFDDNSDDDFAEFEFASPNVDTKTNTDTQHNHKPDEELNNQFDDEFADFASFNESTNSDTNLNEQFIEEECINRLEVNHKLSKLIDDTFISSESTANEQNLSVSTDLFGNAHQNSINLWKRVQDLEDAPSLKLRWHDSHSFQQLLLALKIDPRNILRNSSIPIFASGLGHVLEPTKHNFNATINSTDNINNNTTINTEIDSNCLSADTLAAAPNTPIPPVHFDWNSSGLKNPLDPNPKNAVLFDLDFFITTDDSKNIKNRQIGLTSLEEELLNEKDNAVVDNNETNSDQNIVQQLLSSVKNASTSLQNIPDRSHALSIEAIQVLDELPNLSFMRAKVLMFPINLR